MLMMAHDDYTDTESTISLYKITYILKGYKAKVQP